MTMKFSIHALARWRPSLRTGGSYLALAVLLAVCCLSSEGFRQSQNLFNILRQVSYSGIISIGMTLIIVGGGIDLSVGSLLALSGVLGIMAMNHVADPAAGLIAGALVAGAVGVGGGALNGALVVIGRIPPFIATLGTLSVFRSLALYAADAGLASSGNELFGRLGGASWLSVPLPVWILFCVTFLFAVLLNRTRFGRHLCAVGSSERVAEFAAIHTGRVRFLTYILSGAAVGVSAILLAARLNSMSSTNAGLSYELDAIAAVIIGGTAMSGGRGSVWGTLAGVLILGIVSNVLDMWGVSVNLQGTVKGAVIVAAVLIQRKR